MNSNSEISLNQSFANIPDLQPFPDTAPGQNIQEESTDRLLPSTSSLPNENNCLLQEEIDRISRPLEAYDLRVLFKRNVGYTASSFSGLTQSICRSFHYYVFGNTELHFSILGGDQQAITALACQKKLINSVNYKGESPLMIASKMGNPDTVNLLIEKEAKIDQRDSNGRTPLHHAVQGNSLEVTELLINVGSEVASTDTAGNNCIHSIAETGNLDMMNLFLKYQMPIDEYNAAGVTPLMIAVRNCRSDVVNLLLDLGADITKRGNGAGSQNVFEIALSGENDEIINILIQREISTTSTERILHKNEPTLIFEEIVRKLLHDPESITLTKHWNSENRFSVEVTIEDQTHNLFEIFRKMHWETVHFDDREYTWLKNILSPTELDQINNIDSRIQAADEATNYFRYSFGGDYKKKYKDLNEIDKFLIYSTTHELGYRLNDLLRGTGAHYKLDILQLLPKMGFLVNALNKIPAETLKHFTCRGQNDAYKKDTLTTPAFMHTSRIYKVSKIYARKGRGASYFGGGHVVFFKNLVAYDISGLSSIALAGDYITLPKIITYTKERFNSTTNGGHLPYYFGQLSSPTNEE